MNDSSKKWLLESIQVLGGAFDYDVQANTASLLLDQQTVSLIDADEFSLVDFNPQPVVGAVDIIQLQEKISAIATERGSTVAVRLSDRNDISWPSQKKAEQFLSSANGKVVFNEARVMDQKYLVIYSRCSAVSDEKRSFMAGAAINCSSLTIAPQMPQVLELSLEKLLKKTETIQFLSNPDQQVKKLLSIFLQKAAEQEIVDFNESMRKRMARDSARLYSYYNELYEAARNPSGRKKIEPAMIKSNLDAIQSEYSKKIEDLRIKYLTVINIEPFCAVELTLPSLVSFYSVFMGSKSIQKSIAWNPLTFQNDKSICDCCSGPVESSHVCRNLHWLCNGCWKTCTACGRDYCIICKPNGCSCMH